MQKAMIFKLSLLFFVSALCLPHSFAQGSPQWGLPEGAKARLSKGSAGEMQYSPDGTRLAVASGIGIWLYDTETHQEVALLTGHMSVVSSVAFSPDGRTLASGSTDGTVLLWKLTSLTAFAVEPLARRITTLGNIKRTALLQNYPNPFNPETWIPYQLANDALVTLSIYDQSGHIVRTLNIGHQISGVYRDKAKAAYWDGRNQNGEPVTSGTYFYQLRAGDYTTLRRMVIVK